MNLRASTHVRACVVIMLLSALGVLSTGSTGSHGHMRQHQHAKGSGADQHKHKHHRPRQTIEKKKLLQDNELVHDTEHMKEEMPEYLTPETIKNMSPQELDYHYFKLHDFDDNLRLDGLELLAALGHVHSDDDDEVEAAMKGLSDEEKAILKNHRQKKYEDDFRLYIQLIDEVFEENDLNKDGYLGWVEYIKGRDRNEQKRDI